MTAFPPLCRSPLLWRMTASGRKGKFKPRHYQVPGTCLALARRAYAERISLGLLAEI
jgi:hypothetical protein